jgi:hypothetical protein
MIPESITTNGIKLTQRRQDAKKSFLCDFAALRENIFFESTHE